MEWAREQRLDPGAGSGHGTRVVQEALDDPRETLFVRLVAEARSRVEDHRGILVPPARDYGKPGPKVIHDSRPRAELVLDRRRRDGQGSVGPEVRPGALREGNKTEEFDD